MTEKENKVRQCELDVQVAENKLLEARQNLDIGIKKAQAELDLANTEFIKAGVTLRNELERAKIELERQKAWLAEAKAELERGFEV